MGMFARNTLNMDRITEVICENEPFVALQELVAYMAMSYRREVALVECGESVSVIASTGMTEEREWEEVYTCYIQQKDITGFRVYPLQYCDVCCGYLVMKGRDKILISEPVHRILTLTLYLYKALKVQELVKKQDYITDMYTRDVLIEKNPTSGMLGIFCIYDMKGLQEHYGDGFVNEQVVVLSDVIKEYFGGGYRIGKDCFAVLFQNEELLEGQMIMEEVLDSIKMKGFRFSCMGCCGRIDSFASFGICMQTLQEYTKKLPSWVVELYEPLQYEEFRFLEEECKELSVKDVDTEKTEITKEVVIDAYQDFFGIFG